MDDSFVLFDRHLIAKDLVAAANSSWLQKRTLMAARRKSAIGYTSSGPSAEDISQDALAILIEKQFLVHVYDATRSLGERERFWHRAIKRAVRQASRWKKNRRIAAVSYDELLHSPSIPNDPSAAWWELYETLASLNERDRNVMLLRLAGSTFREIGELQGRSASAVSRQFNRWKAEFVNGYGMITADAVSRVLALLPIP